MTPGSTREATVVRRTPASPPVSRYPRSLTLNGAYCSCAKIGMRIAHSFTIQAPPSSRSKSTRPPAPGAMAGGDQLVYVNSRRRSSAAGASTHSTPFTSGSSRSRTGSNASPTSPCVAPDPARRSKQWSARNSSERMTVASGP